MYRLKSRVQLEIPPCRVNEGRVIEVDFGDIAVTDVANERNRRVKQIPVTCDNNQGNAWIKVTGSEELGAMIIYLATNIQNFGIALYQGEGTSTKLILGDGQSNGQNTIGYRLTNGFTGSHFTFTAVPFKNGSNDLATGSFSASANMSISYF
ncbi:fimbrial protein [Escherichia coli]